MYTELCIYFTFLAFGFDGVFVLPLFCRSSLSFSLPPFSLLQAQDSKSRGARSQNCRPRFPELHARIPEFLGPRSLIPKRRNSKFQAQNPRTPGQGFQNSKPKMFEFHTQDLRIHFVSAYYYSLSLNACSWHTRVSLMKHS